MTTKKTIKKLTLNKKTISNLNDLSMQFVHGGTQQAEEIGDVIAVFALTYCNNCADSRNTQCQHSCFYACDSSKLCIYPVEAA